RRTRSIRLRGATARQEIGEQQTDSNNLGLLERARNFAQWNVRGDERDSELAAGQTHREIFHPTALREKFRLPGKLKSGFVHPRFVNWSGNNGVDFAASCERDRLFKSCGCGSRCFDRRLTWFAIWLPT